MNVLKYIKEHKALSIVLMLIIAIGSTQVLAQLLSNSIEQNITVKGLDDSIDLSIYFDLTTGGDEIWFDSPVWTTIQADKIRVCSGIMTIQITNEDGENFDPSMIDLMVSHRDATYVQVGEDLARDFTVLDNSTVQYTEALWFASGETTSFTKFHLTWLTGAPGSLYTVFIFVELA